MWDVFNGYGNETARIIARQFKRVEEALLEQGIEAPEGVLKAFAEALKANPDLAQQIVDGGQIAVVPKQGGSEFPEMALDEGAVEIPVGHAVEGRLSFIMQSKLF